jgi:tetratricopeptide (TPR) repeat protein
VGVFIGTVVEMIQTLLLATWVAVSAVPTIQAKNVKRPAAEGEDVEPGVPFTQDELRTLPRVCLAQSYINRSLADPIVPEVEREQWKAKMGHDYMHLHHYCWSLMLLARASRSKDARVRNANYKAAISNFDYVISNVSREFPLKPEVYLRKGMTLRLVGDDSGASREFTNAIANKPDYTPAYAALVDLQLDLGNTQDAEKVLDAGLSQVPGSKILAEKKLEMQRRLNESRH